MSNNLIASAKKARNRAYAPYSKFKVGAALLTASGKVYTGCNVENASYGLTICAERVAATKAISEGEKDFRALAIAGEKGREIFPCGACRQFLVEFSSSLVILTDAGKNGFTRRTISQLIPNPFSVQ
ncbi:MAG: cytidine deaminase [Elusimicrobia bacterium]|nr:cytidine deaminase [Elusimicrobiota bacterium]